MSLTSNRLVVAIQVSLPVSGGQQPLVLPLLPLDPGRRRRRGRREIRSGEPGLDSRAQRGVAPKPKRERELAELDAEPLAEFSERPELVQLAHAVEAVPT